MDLLLFYYFKVCAETSWIGTFSEITCFCLLLSHSLSLSLSLSLYSLSVSLSLFFNFSLFLSLFLSISFFLSLSLSCTLSFFIFPSLSLTHFCLFTILFDFIQQYAVWNCSTQFGTIMTEKYEILISTCAQLGCTVLYIMVCWHCGSWHYWFFR